MKVSQDVLQVLSGAACSGNHLRITQQLGRALYVKVDEVLALAGGAWNRKQKAHVFDGAAEDAIDQVILTGEITKPQDFGFFESPPPVVEALLDVAQVADGQEVLEPNAGRGAIALAAVKARADVTCVELLEDNRAALKAAGLRLMTEPDFLKVDPARESRFDRVVMNPPFARRADVLHVVHALWFLAPGGRLASVMSAGVQFRQDKMTTEFRELVAIRGGSIEPLPAGSFKASGTSVNTVIVTIPG